EPVSGSGFIGAVDPIPVHLSRSNLWKVGVPDMVRPFLNPDPVRLLRLVRLIKEAEFHSCGVLGKQRKVHSLTIPSRSERIRTTWQDSHLSSSRFCEQKVR